MEDPNVTRVIRDTDEFMSSQNTYKRKNLPYHKGYLLYGAPGTKKSTTIEAMAIKYNMSVYLVNLNSEGMTDTTLINLISTIPEHSLIVFEEIDEQLKTMVDNANNKVSFGGILSAIDGPQRVSNSCLIVMTTNNKDIISDITKRPLFRPGRIDKIFNFEKIE